jgi:vitamin B12 transporter
MKKSIRLRTRALARFSAPALSVLSLAVATGVQAQGIEVNPVVVSASRMEQPLSDVLSSVSVITRTDIDKSQATSLADLLQGEAGFEFGRNGGPGSTTSFFMRGQDSVNVVIMVDGVRAQTDGIGALTMTDFPLGQIERVEVLRGNSGALYGESAIGGVINIYTRKGKGTPTAYGDITYGARNTSRVNIGYGGSVQDVKFDLNLGKSSTDGFSSKSASASVNPDKDSYASEFVAAKFEKKINNDLNMGFRFNTKNSKTDYDGYTASEVNRFDIKTDTVGIFARQVINEQWSSSLDISQTNFKYEDWFNGAYTTKYLSTTPNGLYEGTQDAFRWFNTYQIRPETILNFGIDKSNDRFNQINTYNMTRDTLAYFAGVTNRVDKLTFQANIRHDQVQVDRIASGVAKDNEANPTTGLFGLGYDLTPFWRFTSTVSTGFRAPTASEVSTTPTLKAENHENKEIGFGYASNETVGRFVYFQTSTEDAIVPNSSYTSYSNVGRVENKGVEGFVRSIWMGNNIRLNIVSQDPVNKVTNKQLARRANNYGSLDVSRAIGDYDIGAKLYVSGQRKNSDFDSYVLASYSIWSFYASRKIDNEWTARVKLDNAFDRQYQLAYGYNTPGRGIYATLQYQPK